MAVPKNQRPELHDANETRKIEDLSVGITTIENAREIEELCALVYFIPETFFE